MLRLPPSKITLSAVEIQDFSIRQRVRLRGTTKHSTSIETFLKPKDLRAKNYGRPKSSENNINEALFRLHGVQQASTSTGYRGDASDFSQYPQHLSRESTVVTASQDLFGEHDPDWYGNQTASGSGQGSRSRVEESNVQVEDSQGENDVTDHAADEESSCEDEYDQSSNSEPSDHHENEHQFLPVSYDSTGDIEDYAGQRETRVQANSSSPSKHRFDYGGFVESNHHDSSSFVPDDSSTPVPVTASLISNEVQRLRARLPLPRSPLHISELVAISPERRHGNTPRVSSYAAPTLLLAHPPRRTPKTYRPRTISYSYDESERASAVYEEPQVNNSDNDESQFDPAQHGEQVSLYEELRGSSLQSISGSIPSSPPAGPVIVRNDDSNREFIFSSPHLSGELPPPFSTVPRGTSLAASIPSTLSHEGYKSDDSGLLVDDHPSSPLRNGPLEESPAEPTSSSMLDRIGRMFSGRYRLRSAGSSPETQKTASSPTTPRQSVENASNLNQSPIATPRRSIRVYDDSLPPSSQPQTPSHLPESRHRSRLHPSFTAPVTRHRPGVLNTSPPSVIRISGSVRRGRRAAGRSDSPLGMGGERGEGFRGLYGGQENTDEDVLFENAARRLFETERERSARRQSDGTPERELTIADVRREHQL